MEGYQKRLVKVFKAYEHEGGGREDGEILAPRVWCGDGWDMVPTCDNLISKEDYCESVVFVLERWRICGVFVDSLSGVDLCDAACCGFSHRWWDNLFKNGTKET